MKRLLNIRGATGFSRRRPGFKSPWGRQYLAPFCEISSRPSSRPTGAVLGLLAALIGCAAPVEPAPAVEWHEDAGRSEPAPVTDAGTPEAAIPAEPELVPDEWPVWLPSPEHARDAWPADLWTERCEREAGQVELTVGSGAEVEDRCSGHVYGCFRSAPPRILVSTDRPLPPEHVAAHELAHWLYSCSGLGSSNDNHGEPLFEESIDATLDVWRSAVAELDPEPAEDGACPGGASCEQGVCRDPAGYQVVSAEGDSCEPLVIGGRFWQPEESDGQCVVTCGGQS